MLQDQRILPLAQLGERVGEQLGAGVVSAGERAQIEAYLRLFLRRGKHVADLRHVGGRELARQREVAPGHRPRPGTQLLLALFPGRRRAFESDDVLQGELLERRALVGTLQQIEQGQPRERRNLRVNVVGHALLEHLPRRRGVAACVEQRGVLEHGT